jgi:hypothetical protein
LIDKCTWEFINTFAPWFAAIGTLGAVIVSLYLARQDRRIKLKVSAGYRIIAIPGERGESYLVIYIVNAGHRDAQVTGIGWKVGFINKKYGQTIIINGPHSSPIPIRLKDGEEATYSIPLQGETRWSEDFIQKFLNPHPKFNLFFTKVQIFTSIGKVFESKIEKGLRNKLMEIVNQ